MYGKSVTEETKALISQRARQRARERRKSNGEGASVVAAKTAKRKRGRPQKRTGGSGHGKAAGGGSKTKASKDLQGDEGEEKERGDLLSEAEKVTVEEDRNPSEGRRSSSRSEEDDNSRDSREELPRAMALSGLYAAEEYDDILEDVYAKIEPPKAVSKAMEESKAIAEKKKKAQEKIQLMRLAERPTTRPSGPLFIAFGAVATFRSLLSSSSSPFVCEGD